MTSKEISDKIEYALAQAKPDYHDAIDCWCNTVEELAKLGLLTENARKRLCEEFL